MRRAGTSNPRHKKAADVSPIQDGQPSSPQGSSNPEPTEAARRGNPISRLVNHWFDRVMGAMKGDGLSESEAQYAPHRTTRDFVWNTIGSSAWAMVFPIVTMVSTRIVGVEQAGMISMAFVVGILLMFLGNFGVRTFQVADQDFEYSFKDYQANRWITCALMVVAGVLWCLVNGYGAEMLNITIGVVLYKMVDALADVYEGRLQQVDKLYLAGISQALRSASAIVVFAIALLITHSPIIACYGMAIIAAVTFVAVTWPLTLMEAPPSKPFQFRALLNLFRMCAPLFLALFLFNVIENMPKFFMEAMLPYDNQLYYNAIYFPAQMILICSQLVYKPLLLRIAGVWQSAGARLKFNLILIAIVSVIVVFTLCGCFLMDWFGIDVLNFLYGIDFKQFHGLIMLMLITGGLTAGIDFLYQVITIMHRQKDVTVLYLITFVFSLFVPYLLIHYAELEGAVLSYVIIEAILFVLLVWEYFRIQMDMRKASVADSDPGAEMAPSDKPHARPYVPVDVDGAERQRPSINDKPKKRALPPVEGLAEELEESE